MKKVNGFNVIVKHMGFLKHVPLLPHLFDAQLKLWTLITRPHLLDAIDTIETEILKWAGTNVGVHKYGGIQFNYHNKEIGHIHSNGLLDIRFNRKIQQQLLADGRVTEHHIFKKSGWISFYMNTDDDRLYAQWLLKIAYSILQESYSNKYKTSVTASDSVAISALANQTYCECPT